jgi:hypothetical protein
MEDEWIKLSLDIREFLNWDLGSETSRAGWEFSLFFSVPQKILYFSFFGTFLASDPAANSSL